MPNIKSQNAEWLDVYAESGIAPGTAVLIQNQSATSMRIRENTIDEGYIVPPLYERESTGSAVLQVRTAGGTVAFVQESA